MNLYALFLFILSIFSFTRYKGIFLLLTILLNWISNIKYLPIVLSTVAVSNFIFSHWNISSDYYHAATVRYTYENSVIVIEDGSYYYIETNNDFKYGDKLVFNCYYSDVNKIDSLDFRIFLNSQGAFGYCKPESIAVEKECNMPTCLIENSIESSGNIYHSDFVKMLILGDTSNLQTDVYEDSISLGIAHLFSISGFHIGIFILLINKFTARKDNKAASLSSIVISFLFLFICRFPTSGLRSWLYVTTMSFNRRLGVDDSITSHSQSFSILVAFRPYLIMNIGFWISQLVALQISIIWKSDYKRKNLLLLSISSFILSQFLLLSFSETISIFAPIMTLLLAPIIEFLFIALILTLPFHFIWPFIDLICNLVYLLIDFLTNIFFVINVSSINHLESASLSIFFICSTYYVESNKDYLIQITATLIMTTVVLLL